MERAAIAVTVFIITTIVSSLFVSRSLKMATRLSFLDVPGPRSTHRQPVPRAAGLAIYLAFVLGIGLTFSAGVDRFPAEIERLLLLLVGGGLLTGVMVFDDALGLHPLTKLIWQSAAAAIVIVPRLHGPDHGIVIDQFNLPVFSSVQLPLGLAILVTFIWIVGFCNALNFVDGLDGLAGTVTLIACTVLFLHTYFRPRDDPQFTISLIPMVLGAAIVGFLPFNWHPAKIIMGDAGAHFLGFTLAVIAIIGGAKIATAMLALGLPAADLAWVVIYRIAHGRSPMTGDRGHLHHRLIDRGWGPQRVVLWIGGLSVLFGAASLLLRSRELKLGAIVIVGLVVFVIVTIVARDDNPDRYRLSRRTRNDSV